MADPLLCPLSGTTPNPSGFPRGHYWDSGSHHCRCGAIVEWVGSDQDGPGRPGWLDDHVDPTMARGIARLRAMPRADVEAALWPDGPA